MSKRGENIYKRKDGRWELNDDDLMLIIGNIRRLARN